MKKDALEPKVQYRKVSEVPKKERKKVISPPFASSVGGTMTDKGMKRKKTPKRTVVK